MGFLWAQLVNLQVVPNACLIAYVDSHPNAGGRRILAHQLYEGLMALPAECWELDRITLPGSTAGSR